MLLGTKESVNQFSEYASEIYALYRIAYLLYSLGILNKSNVINFRSKLMCFLFNEIYYANILSNYLFL